MSEIKTINDAINVLAPFKNVFRAADYLESVFQRAAGIEEDTQKLKNEQLRAEAATSQAKRDLLALQAKLAEARAEVEMMAEQKSNLIDEGTERAKVSLVTVKAELDKARQNAAHTRKDLARDITDKTATVEQLKKAIERLQANKKELEGAATSIEANAISQNEQINANKQALEREVGNLQAQKLTLNSEVKRLQANLEEAKRHDAERKQAQESAHRAKQELQAIADQLEAKRQDLSDLNESNRAAKEIAAIASEEKRVLARETANLQAQKTKLEREIAQREKTLDAQRHKEVKEKQAEAN